MTKLLECTRVMTCLFLLLTSVVCLADDTSLWKIQKTLAGKKYIDLTHEFAPGIPRWPGFPDETRKTIYWYDKRPDTMGTGFFSELFTHVGQWGTHVDPPAHFVKGLRTVDQIDPKEMILPLVVIDVHGEAAANPDYTNHYQIELLTNLDQMPEAGAIAIVSFPKPKNGSGFPARVFAIVP